MTDFTQGLRILRNMDRFTLKECRKKFKQTVRCHWVNKKLEHKSNRCEMKHHRMKMDGEWTSTCDNDGEIKCVECRCYWEVTFVCNVLEGWEKYKY